MEEIVFIFFIKKGWKNLKKRPKYIIIGGSRSFPSRPIFAWFRTPTEEAATLPKLKLHTAHFLANNLGLGI